MYLKLRCYREFYPIASLHRDGTDQTTSMKYTFWLSGVPSKVLQQFRCREGSFLE